MSGTLTFATGETSMAFTIPLVTGDHFAGTRSATLVLSNAQGATLGYPEAVLNLTSDPAPPSSTTVATSPPKATSSTPAAVVAPTIAGVTGVVQKGQITSLVITFQGTVDAASAGKLAAYSLRHVRRQVASHPGPHTANRPNVVRGAFIRITQAVYDPTLRRATLTVSRGLRAGRSFELQVAGVGTGVWDLTGAALIKGSGARSNHPSSPR
jgi:hypothetical protein